MKRMSLLKFIVLVMIAAVISVACNLSEIISSKSGKAADESPGQTIIIIVEPTAAQIVEPISEPTTEPTAEPTAEPIVEPVADSTDGVALQEQYSVGDVIALSGKNIVLIGAEFTDNLLAADFAIANTGSESTNVSSLIAFSARNADGTTLDQEYFECGSRLDGPVAPGDRIRGQICWKNANPGAKIIYEPDLFSSEAVTWQVTESIPPTNSYIAEIDNLDVDSSNVGTEISFEGEKIILNSAAINNGVLTANFTVTNTGTEVLELSQYLNFSARSAEGRILNQEFFSCGAGPDGSVQPGDSIRGDVCWENASSGTRIYYAAGFFGTQTVLWIID